MWECTGFGGTCGNGNLDPGEECDDDNTTNADGCSPTCQIEPCWACGGEPSVCELAPATTTVASSGAVGRNASVAINTANGFPVIAYGDETNRDVKLAVCTDATCTAPLIRTLDTLDGADSSGQGEGVIIGADGFPTVAYFWDNPGNGCLRVAHCSDSLCGAWTTSGNIDCGGNTGSENGLVLGADGFPLISYFDSNSLSTVHCTSHDCSSFDPPTVVSPGATSSGRGTASVLGTDNLGLIAHTENTGLLFRVGHCANAACTSLSTQTTLDSGVIANNDRTKGMVIGADGFALISYPNNVANTLKVAHCTNTACSTFGLSTIDNSGTVGNYTSMALDQDDRAVIAYYDETNGDLKLARCANTACTSAAITTVDATGDVGKFASIAVSPDGKAAIAYYDDTNDDLKLAVCGSAVGDGNVTPDEECDDGNTTNGDGCSSTGEIETCWTCSGEPSSCAPASSGSGCPDDGLFCNGTESCDGAGACVGSGDPCAGGSECNTTCNEASDDCFDPNGTACSDEPNPCTVDTCDGAGTCGHMPGNAGAICRSDGGACDVAETCDGANAACPADGFETSGTPCGDPADDACTDPDTCDGAGSCQGNHAGSGSPCPDDGQVCTSDQCDGAGSCAHPAGNAGTECRPDAGQCDVAEQCDGSNPTCPPDGFEANGTGCNDGNLCTQTDQCQSGVCTGSNPLVCNDSDPCTVDGCDPGSGCVGDELPRSGCRGANKSILSITNRSDDDTLDKFLWLWNLGEATSQAEFGDPTASANYTLCVYQPGNGVLWRADVPASMPLWKPLGDKGWKYKDTAGTANGVQKMQLKASTEARARVLVKGKGINLPDPTVGNLVTPVTAQLHNSDTGLCWDATYTAPKKNTGTQFKAKAP